MSQGKFSIFFSPSIRPRIWFICFCCCLGFLLLFLVLMLAMLYNCLSIFIMRNVPHSFSSSASFLGRDLIISVFVSSHMDGLNLPCILNLPSVLDCLPPFVRKFWFPPLVTWKYVKTSGRVFQLWGVGKICLCFSS